MPAGRFLLRDVPLSAGAEVALPAEVAHQVRDVLRLAPGARIHLLDGRGAVYPADLLRVERAGVTARLGAAEAVQTQPAPPVMLAVGMLKAAKWELVLQKGTELGVSAFVPLRTARAVAATEALGAAKTDRWQRILAEAVEQCGGATLPDLRAPTTLPALLAQLPLGGVALMPWEEERGAPLLATLGAAVARAGGAAQVAGVCLLVGPEGGFTPGEVALARAHGALPVTLGPRILRAETAALAAATLTLAALGALDTPPAGG